MKNIVLISAFTFTFSLLCFAQTNTYEDVVYLKNGSIIRGMIIEQVPNKQLKVQTRDGSVFVYQMDEVVKIAKEPLIKPDDNNTNNSQSQQSPNQFDVKSHGGAFLLDLGTTIYISKSLGIRQSQAVFSFRTLLGGRTSKNFLIGLDLGVEAGGITGVIVPAGLRMRASFLKTRGTPFLDIGTGYVGHYATGSISYTYTVYYSGYGPRTYTGTKEVGIKNGLYSTVSLGGKVWASNKVALNIRIGYQILIFKLENGQFGDEIDHSLPIMFGLEF